MGATLPILAPLPGLAPLGARAGRPAPGDAVRHQPVRRGDRLVPGRLRVPAPARRARHQLHRRRLQPDPGRRRPAARGASAAREHAAPAWTSWPPSMAPAAARSPRRRGHRRHHPRRPPGGAGGLRRLGPDRHDPAGAVDAGAGGGDRLVDLLVHPHPAGLPDRPGRRLGGVRAAGRPRTATRCAALALLHLAIVGGGRAVLPDHRRAALRVRLAAVVDQRQRRRHPGLPVRRRLRDRAAGDLPDGRGLPADRAGGRPPTSTASAATSAAPTRSTPWAPSSARSCRGSWCCRRWACSGASTPRRWSGWRWPAALFLVAPGLPAPPAPAGRGRGAWPWRWRACCCRAGTWSNFSHRASSGSRSPRTTSNGAEPSKKPWETPELVFYEDGVSTTVSVDQWGKTFSMKNNGKVDASSDADMPTQITRRPAAAAALSPRRRHAPARAWR